MGPTESIAFIKQSVINAEEMSVNEGLLEEFYLGMKSAALPESKRRMKKALELGIQTYEGQLELDKMLEKLSEN